MQGDDERYEGLQKEQSIYINKVLKKVIWLINGQIN